ncbi:protein AF-10, partial [Notothenia coriiceps]|uniref:Protein AF-10 n=1 Tax=Notothenia coriiceps TaxID=8208 RepID=A0A6I9N643_9TELE
TTPSLLQTFISGSSVGGVPSLPTSSQKRLDDSSARFTTANFQEVSSALSGGSKDGLAAADAGKAASSEAKNKKNIVPGHVVGQRGGRKSLSSSGKPLPSAVVTMATSSTSASASTGPFHQGLLLTSASKTPSAPSSSDFLSFSDPSLRPGGGTTFSSPPSFSSCLVKPSSEGGASEGTATLFGSLVSATTASAVGGKLYENSHSLTSSETPSLGGSAAYKRPPPSSSGGGGGAGGGAGEGGGGDDGLKKKKKGNWRNRFGPCFTTEVKPSEAATSLSLPTSTTTSSSSSASPSSSSSSALSGRPGLVSSSGLGVGVGGGGGERGLGVSAGIQKSPSLLRNGSLQSNSSSSGTGAGVFSGADGSTSGSGAASVGGSELSQQQPTPSLSSPSPFTATAPLTSTANTHVSGSVFNLAPSHMFGNRLNPNSAMAALIAQSEASPADQEVGDGSSGVGAQGFSIRASPKTTPRSPIGGLQIRYDSSGSLPGPALGLLGAGGSGGETLPPVATSIEQLLERQWNEGQSFLLQQGAQGDVLGMLKALHQLQEENRRLEEQIKNLTMKKERLQLLSAQLSVPFTPSSDLKGGHLAGTDSSFPASAQDGASCGGHSSSGSTSSLSTPPSVSQSPPQLNGRVTGLMGALGAGSALSMGGIVGGLNGVIQNPAGPPHTPAAATMPAHNSSATSKSSAARLGLLSEQHRLLLQHHQLQQLLSAQPSAEQQQVLLYQLMQQQQELQQLQSLSSSAQIPSMSSAQLPINNQSAITANPFLAMQHAHADSQKPRLGEKALGVAGQEKT